MALEINFHCSIENMEIGSSTEQGIIFDLHDMCYEELYCDKMILPLLGWGWKNLTSMNVACHGDLKAS